MEPEKIEPQITATWARETSKAIMSKKAEEQLTLCLRKIKDAVSKNDSYTTMPSLEDIVKVELAKRGFSISFQEGYDQRDASYFYIKW